jgi:50S ribosomal protein L16 3-hydroxylase
MDIQQTSALLGGLSPAQFMRRYWQKKPLVVRQAIEQFKPLLTRSSLFKLASLPTVESRLISQIPNGKRSVKKAVQPQSSWEMRSGPFAARALPSVAQPGWTLLVQGVDAHHTGIHDLLQKFRFVPDARLDDVMVSYASPGGGVGPHFDSYDVFLFQASGRRRWRISQQQDLTLQDGMPLKILQNFEAEDEFTLDAGDMLYLPPRYAHEGVAVASESTDGVDDCMTYSIGFRSPSTAELATELLHRLADFHLEDEGQQEQGVNTSSARKSNLYKDPRQTATLNPAKIPNAFLEFAQKAVTAALKDPLALACTLGEHLTEPKNTVWFDEPETSEWVFKKGCQLDGRTRMMYDDQHIFINGESHRAKGADAGLMRKLADQRQLTESELSKASRAALGLLEEWASAGWLHDLPNSVES